MERRVKNKETGVCDKEKELKMDTSSCSTMEDELIVLKIEAKKWPLIMVFKGMTVNFHRVILKSQIITTMWTLAILKEFIRTDRI